MPGLEWLLVAGVIAFYLQDAVVLLHYDEFVVSGGARGWHGATGGIEWSGRFLWLPNPLAPHEAAFLGTWEPADRAAAGSHGGASLDAFLAALLPFRVGALALGVVLMAGLPLLLWLYPHPVALLGALGLAYAIVGCLVLVLWRRRERFGLGARTVGWLAFECLACPPHAINLVRKLALRHGPCDAAAIVAFRLAAGDHDQLEQAMSHRRLLFGAPR